MKTKPNLKAMAAEIVEDVTKLAAAIKAHVPKLSDEAATQYALEIMADAAE